jgi:hypothetical protein
MPFVRVRDPQTGHEYDTPERFARSVPELEVIDPEPVEKPRPPKHFVKPPQEETPLSGGDPTKEEESDGS